MRTLDWKIHSTWLTISDIVAEEPLAKAALLKHLKYQYYYTRALKDGWEDFQWDVAHEQGWFSVADYSLFEELVPWKAEVERKWEAHLAEMRAKHP